MAGAAGSAVLAAAAAPVPEREGQEAMGRVRTVAAARRSGAGDDEHPAVPVAAWPDPAAGGGAGPERAAADGARDAVHADAGARAGAGARQPRGGHGAAQPPRRHVPGRPVARRLAGTCMIINYSSLTLLDLDHVTNGLAGRRWCRTAACGTTAC